MNDQHWDSRQRLDMILSETRVMPPEHIGAIVGFSDCAERKERSPRKQQLANLNISLSVMWLSS